MNRARIKRKRSEVKTHRDIQYTKALDGLINGKIPPTYVAERWRKRKALLKKHRKPIRK